MNYIIIDDEPIARDGIQLMAKAFDQLNFCGSFGSPIAAAAFMKKNKVDLIFLDINMPEQNGLEFAESMESNVLIIFTTAYAQYAVDSYALDAIDYLVKPIQPKRFEKAVHKALSYFKLLISEEKTNSVQSIEPEFMFVRSDRKFFKVVLKDILFIEGLKDYVIIHLKDQKIITAMNIKTIGQQLPAADFHRISKSFIINIHQITSLDTTFAYINEHEIPIGISFRDAFLEQYFNGKIILK